MLQECRACGNQHQQVKGLLHSHSHHHENMKNHKRSYGVDRLLLLLLLTAAPGGELSPMVGGIGRQAAWSGSGTRRLINDIIIIVREQQQSGDDGGRG